MITRTSLAHTRSHLWRNSLEVFSVGDLDNVKRILTYGAPIPPHCICGNPEYWFYVDNRDRLVAECRVKNCRYKRIWSVAGRAWGPFGAKGGGEKSTC